MILGLLCALAILPLQARDDTGSQPPVLFIVDASGSMAEKFGDVPRMSAARLMLDEQLGRLGDDVPVGLVAYGNRIPGCDSARIYAPIRTQNRKSLKTQVSRLEPAGSTPIARTLRLVGRDLLPFYPGTRVVLISDGAESCGGDPEGEARRLLAVGTDLKINVIGLSVDEQTASELGRIAKAGEGRYFDVQNHGDLEEAIRQSVQDAPPVGNYAPPPTPLERRNTRVERAWSDAPRRRLSPTHSETQRRPLEITRIKLRGVENGEAVYDVAFRFYHQRPGNFMVNVKAVDRPAAAGPGGRVRADAGITGESFYRSDRGSGVTTLRIPAGTRAPIYVQAELWEISNVPEHLYISDPEELEIRR